MTGRLPVRLGIGIPPCEYAPAAYPPAQNMCNGVFTAESVGGLGEVATALTDAIKYISDSHRSNNHSAQRNHYSRGTKGRRLYDGHAWQVVGI